jgi:hypothetical protein
MTLRLLLQAAANTMEDKNTWLLLKQLRKTVC